MHGSPTTKELKKHSSRLVEGAETWRGRGEARAERMPGEVRWWTVRAIPHLHADKSGETMVERDRPQNPGLKHGKLKTQNP